jgi:hypothetical protein
VVLELGKGYGGDGDWAWSIPRQTGTGLAKGVGVYGHGAVMLPGAVMMVIGDIQFQHQRSLKQNEQIPL